MSMTHPLPSPAPARKKLPAIIVVVMFIAAFIVLVGGFGVSQALAYKVTPNIPLVLPSQTVTEARYQVAIPANWKSEVLPGQGSGATMRGFTAVYANGDAANVTMQHGDDVLGFGYPGDGITDTSYLEGVGCRLSDVAEQATTWNGYSAKLVTYVVDCADDSPVWQEADPNIKQGPSYNGVLSVLPGQDAPIEGGSWSATTADLAEKAQQVVESAKIVG